LPVFPGKVVAETTLCRGAVGEALVAFAVSAGGELVAWVVHAAPDISVNLIAAAIGGVLVWLTTNARRRIKLVRARRFWRAMGGRRPFIVLGAHEWSARRWAQAGVVGMSDIAALAEIESQLRELGYTGKIVESKQLSPQDLKADLILIGGPVANAATETMMARPGGAGSYCFVRDPKHRAAAVRDGRTGGTLTPQYDHAGEPTGDYGLIIRTANPLAPETSRLVIVAGCWEQGTAAAAEKLGDRKFLRLLKGMKHFEALVETTVVHGAHYNTKVVEIREISPAE
jgi:hypothetical protein